MILELPRWFHSALFYILSHKKINLGTVVICSCVETMKNTLLFLGLMIAFISSLFSIAASQTPTGPPKTELIGNPGTVSSKKLSEVFFSSEKSIIDLLSPVVSFINFDDVLITGKFNSVEIAPNRYAGVRFYSPYPFTSTWVTYSNRYSYPNSLIVGYICDSSTGHICSDHVMVVDFVQDSKDVSFLWGRDFSYNSGSISIYQGSNYEYIAEVPVSLPSNWQGFSLSQFSQRIRRIILRHPGQAPNITGHIFLDNFQFTPVTTVSPIGWLDSVSTTDPVGALGWSVDPDNESASNHVDCYVDGQFIGRVTANEVSPDVPYPGNHRFSMPIPQNWRDGNQHTMNCFGLDVTGGDPPALLSGSPKTFRFQTPIGWLESITADGDASGWSQDPTVPEQSNMVHFYVDGPAGSGTFVGQTIANIPRPDITPGNHGFRFTIPNQFRDGQQHTLYAYGIDLTGDHNKILNGSPKTFTLSPSRLLKK